MSNETLRARAYSQTTDAAVVRKKLGENNRRYLRLAVHNPDAPLPVFVSGGQPLEKSQSEKVVSRSLFNSAESDTDLHYATSGDDDEDSESAEFESITTSTSSDDLLDSKSGSPLAKTNTVVRLRTKTMAQPARHSLSHSADDNDTLRRSASQPSSSSMHYNADNFAPPPEIEEKFSPRRRSMTLADANSPMSDDLHALLVSRKLTVVKRSGTAPSSPRVGHSTVFMPDGKVQVLSHTHAKPKKPINIDQQFTLIFYCSDPMGSPKRQIFIVPNKEIDTYMRTALMRAHASTLCDDPCRPCNCGNTDCEHPLPDCAAKFVAIYVLDPKAPVPSRKLVSDHHKRQNSLARGAWAQYRQDNSACTDFSTSPASHIYSINLYI